jgi:hypothetical protein
MGVPDETVRLLLLHFGILKLGTTTHDYENVPSCGNQPDSLSPKMRLNSLTAIRFWREQKTLTIGFYSRNSTKSTVNPNTTIPQI